uniref:Uncharacterized protein n=1 Tax=Trichogramma kaykai TaxID=54128 RepID=A0ABD2W3Y5_9HYME
MYEENERVAMRASMVIKYRVLGYANARAATWGSREKKREREREPRSGRPRYIIHESNYCYNTKITVSEFGFSICTTPEYAEPRYYMRSTLRLQQAIHSNHSYCIRVEYNVCDWKLSILCPCPPPLPCSCQY